MKPTSSLLRTLIFLLGIALFTLPFLYAEENTDPETSTDGSLSFTTGFELTGRHSYEMLDGQPSEKFLYETTSLGIYYSAPFFDLTVEGLLVGNDRYTNSEERRFLYNRYFLIDNALLDFYAGPFSLTV